MGLNHQNINALLEKYWQGYTSIEEEQALKEFFRYNTPAQGQEEIAAYFSMIDEESDHLSTEFDDRILAEIPEGKTRNIINFNWRVAAAVVAIFGLSLWLINDNGDSNDMAQQVAANAVTEEVDNSEVQEAFEQTKSALFLISSKLNKGTEQASKITKFHDAQVMIKSEEK